MKLIGPLFVTVACLLDSGHFAMAQSSPYLTAKDPSQTYFRLKKSYDRIPTEYFENGARLASCISASELYGIEIHKRLPLTNALSELAFDILWIEGALRVGGYPRELWSEDLNAIERNALSRRQNLNGAKISELAVPRLSHTR
jgi:hypothetical protein